MTPALSNDRPLLGWNPGQAASSVVNVLPDLRQVKMSLGPQFLHSRNEGVGLDQNVMLRAPPSASWGKAGEAGSNLRVTHNSRVRSSGGGDTPHHSTA